MDGHQQIFSTNAISTPSVDSPTAAAGSFFTSFGCRTNFTCFLSLFSSPLPGASCTFRWGCANALTTPVSKITFGVAFQRSAFIGFIGKFWLYKWRCLALVDGFSVQAIGVTKTNWIKTFVRWLVCTSLGGSWFGGIRGSPRLIIGGQFRSWERKKMKKKRKIIIIEKW